MPDYRKGSHTVYDIHYHLVWVTKYRYPILRSEIAERVRDLVRQICMSREITVVKGHVSTDHVHGFHPEGMKCPHCGASRDESRLFRVYRCRRCSGVYNVYS